MSDSQSFTVLSQICSAFFDQLDRKTLISRILDAAIELTHGDRGTIFLAPSGMSDELPQDPGQLSSLVATGLDGKEIKVSIQDGIAGHVFRTGKAFLTNDAQHDPLFCSEVDVSTGYITRSILSVPLLTPGARKLGVIEILNSRGAGFNENDLKILHVLALFSAIALETRETIDHLTEATESLKQGKWNWAREIESIPLSSSNPQLQELYGKLPFFAQSDSSVLIEGESGTGKEVVAQFLHVKSRRRDRAFVAINCAAIPESLFEAELFGVARGAATGTSARKGKIEMSQGGTLFLDEIGELPLSMQAKLLRVLQEKSVTRVGSDETPRSVDFRLVAATNKNLATLVREGRFREDLFYRLNVVHLRLFPLRERREDIPELCQNVLRKFVQKRGWKPKTLTPAALALLVGAPWSGNIRELQNKLESAVIHSAEKQTLEPGDFNMESLLGGHEELVRLTSPGPVNFDIRSAKEQLEADLIERALAETKGNKSQAARLLGITREGLRKAMNKISGKGSPKLRLVEASEEVPGESDSGYDDVKKAA
ncbi:MAG: hypothetical protein A2X94_08355 [Bdellovibrionales bacterium GWB1_55_8]|nr:MAG: hypothetical protein A2X94_08355 [Bdellovibrionales bacterium GWB1_55_8]